MGMRTDRLACHHAIFAKGNQYSPIWYRDTVAAVHPRERLGDEARQHVEPVGKKVFKLEEHRLIGRNRVKYLRIAV